EMEVRREDGDGVHAALRVLLGARETADDQRVEAPGGAEERPTLDRPLCDLDKRPWGGKMTQVSHTLIDEDRRFDCTGRPNALEEIECEGIGCHASLWGWQWGRAPVD
ncbi:MAG: hypothetical protein AAGC60_02305, partial [Acidobacteriota bacterium]